MKIYEEKVSVIIPVYNCKNTIFRTLQSVQQQTYANLEIIVIDDGSSDGSAKICDRIAKMDTRIVVFHKENGGVSSARNLGIKIATGNYLSFVDSDDLLAVDFIETLVRVAKEENADIVAANYLEILESEADQIYSPGFLAVRSKRIDKYHGNCQEKILFNEQDLLKAYLQHKAYCYVVWSKLYKTDFIRKFKFLKLKYTEDTNYIVRLSSGNPKLVPIDYCGYYYVQNPASITHNSELLPRIINTLLTADYVYRQSIIKYKMLEMQAREKLLGYIFSAVSLIGVTKSLSNNERKSDIAILKKYLKLIGIHKILNTKKSKYKILVIFLFCPNILILAFKVFHSFRKLKS